MDVERLTDDLILVVDDEGPVRRTIAKVLRRAGYECETAANLGEARAMLCAHHFGLAICDLRLAQEDGMEVVDEIHRRYAETAVLMATGVDDPAVAGAAAGSGALGYLVKPFSNNQLLIAVEGVFRSSGRERKHREEKEEAGKQSERQIVSLRDVVEQLRDQVGEGASQQLQVMERLTDAVRIRDIETGSHIQRLGEYSELLASLIGLSSYEASSIGRAAPMHDVGKIAIPDAILHKPGTLDPREWDTMRTHAQLGHEILAGCDIAILDLAASIALTHHERHDGHGYPSHLCGDAIPIEGRIVAVVDVFDALISDRPYRRALPPAEVERTMKAGRGDHFDPEIFDAFIIRFADFVEIASQTLQLRRD